MPEIVAPPASLVDETAPSGAGLVICAITPPERVEAHTAHVADLYERNFSFPSAFMVDAAASMFPRPLKHRETTRSASSEQIGTFTYRDDAEGPYSRLEIGPGIVRVARTDHGRAERTSERLREAALAARQYNDEQMHVPMALALFDAVSDGTRDVISAWSAKSRARMISTICELDLSGIVAGETLPCMVTLTLPGDWLTVAPDAATIASKFDNFTRAWEKQWGPLVCIWKREFQRRGAPHWHLWTVPPVPMHRMREFREWLSEAWTTALQIEDQGERSRSLLAGTGVDFAEGLRARDPKRLAVYFLKESLGGEGKAYQNGAPPEWDGQSVGRFWGYRGIEKAVAAAPLDAAVAVQVVRTIRRWQRAQGVTREKVVMRGFAPTTGEIRFRKVRRRANVIGSAGWVAVNDGASFASQLARHASALALNIDAARDLFAVNGRDYLSAESPVEFTGVYVSAAPPSREENS